MDLLASCEVGDLADRIWVHWGRDEEVKGKARREVIRGVAKEYEMGEWRCYEVLSLLHRRKDKRMLIYRVILTV